ncbi:MAG TPA: ABC transporter ATP-binding protein [Acidimicrobiia bacterium]|jgi:ABC-2 type transport system ATP-binding protein
MPVAEPALVVRGVTRRFGEVTALDRVDFQVEYGQVIGLLGHNGAGKTTTIRLLNGLLAPDEGEVRTMGLDPVADGAEVRRHTGVLTETPSLDDRMSGLEAMRFWAAMWGVPKDAVDRRVMELLERFRLTDRARDRIGGYSRGMRQRLALARTLLHDPPLLFLDEPTAALDPVAARGVRDMVRTLAAEDRRTVLICTHNLAEAQDLCDRVVILRRGRVLADGTTAELVGAASVPVALILEVEGEQVSEARRITETFGEVKRVDGGRIDLDGVTRERLPDLVAALVEAGVGIYRVAPEEPSLESAYLALYGEETEG